jgi:hypothetical protein
MSRLGPQRTNLRRWIPTLVVIAFVGINLYIPWLYLSQIKRPKTPVPSEPGVTLAVSTTSPQPSTTASPTPTVEPSDSDAGPYQVDTTVWPLPSMEEMVKQAVDQKYWGSNASVDAAERLKRATGCNILRVPFDPAEDKRCIEYLTDLKHWKALITLDQKYDARTIKFKVEFPMDLSPIPLSSVLKVPQRLFPNEAFSEVGSYHADRVLNINRIPPTGWVCIPVAMIRQSVHDNAARMETVEEFLKESSVSSFTDWIEADLFKYAQHEELISKTKHGDPCIGASIQLFVGDVHHLLDSKLKIPYIPHNDSWMHHFDFNPHQKPDFLSAKWAPTMLHLSEIACFDYVLGNPDRSPNKNNFVVGGCARHCDEDPSDVVHPGHPTFVHLDQGMGFYGSPSRNPIANARKRAKRKSDPRPNTMCLFRAPLLNRIHYLSQKSSDDTSKTRFEVALIQRFEPEIMAQVTETRLQEAARRIHQLLEVVDNCLQTEFKQYVIAP